MVGPWQGSIGTLGSGAFGMVSRSELLWFVAAGLKHKISTNMLQDWYSNGFPMAHL